MSAPASTRLPPPHNPIGAARISVSLVVILGGLALLLFVPTGRLDWAEGWALLAASSVFRVLYAASGLRKDPDLLRKRSRAAEKVKPWDRAIMAAYTIFLLLTPIVAGLAKDVRGDSVGRPCRCRPRAGLACVGAGRCADLLGDHDQHVTIPDGAHAFGEEHREQVVVTAGPYRFVRHRMYLGIVLLFLSMPVALESWGALMPGTVIGALFVIKTAMEDRMLWNDSQGYVNNIKCVRYHLVPRIW